MLSTYIPTFGTGCLPVEHSHGVPAASDTLISGVLTDSHASLIC